MTKEEKQKAIDALKKSAPFMGVTQEEFIDYKQTLNKVMDLLEQESCGDCISRKAVLDLVRDAGKFSLCAMIEDLPSVTPTQSWIPLVRREPTEEEKAYYKEIHGEELGYMIDSPMPSDGQEVLVSVENTVSQDTFFEEFYNFDGWDISDVDAWQPLPKPYSEVEE